MGTDCANAQTDMELHCPYMTCDKHGVKFKCIGHNVAAYRSDE